MGKKTLIFKILGIIFITLLILSTGCLIYTVLLFNKIETFYLIMGSLVLLCIINLVVGTFILSIKNLKTVKFIIFSSISILLSILFIVGAWYIFTAYNKLNDMNKTVITHKTALVSMNKDLNIENLEGYKIGLLDNNSETTEGIEGNILPYEVIDKFNLDEKNEIIEYSDTLTLMFDLYQGELDLIFVSANYKYNFKSVEGYENIEDEVFTIYEYGKEYEKSKIEDTTTSKVDLNEPFTVLLLGVDSAVDGLAENASFNGDTIMLITFDPKTLNATMFSIPRDTYVTMACGGSTQKINHAAWGGTNCMVKTVQNLTGINIDYYVKINFKGVVDLVNALGGIEVNVPEPDYLDKICTDNSDRSGQVCIESGWQTLNGEEALVLARNRKAFAQGDFQRGQNQQIVVEGIMQKAKTIRSLNQFYEILDVISKNIDTNMTTDEMLSFYEIGKKLLLSNDNNVINIQKTWLRGYSLYAYEPSVAGYSYTFQYYRGSLNDIVEAMEINLGLREKEVIKEIHFSINDPYEKTIIGNKSYSESKLTLLPNFANGYSVESAKNWGSNHGITINVEYITEGDMFNPAYPSGKIVGQSAHEGMLLVRVGSSMTIYVIDNDNPTSIDDETTNNENEENENENTEEETQKPNDENNDNDSEVTDGAEEGNTEESSDTNESLVPGMPTEE